MFDPEKHHMVAKFFVSRDSKNFSSGLRRRRMPPALTRGLDGGRTTRSNVPGIKGGDIMGVVTNRSVFEHVKDGNEDAILIQRAIQRWFRDGAKAGVVVRLDQPSAARSSVERLIENETLVRLASIRGPIAIYRLKKGKLTRT
jgi:hypothetical protein